jgi:hypothetical protein
LSALKIAKEFPVSLVSDPPSSWHIDNGFNFHFLPETQTATLERNWQLKISGFKRRFSRFCATLSAKEDAAGLGGLP